MKLKTHTHTLNAAHSISNFIYLKDTWVEFIFSETINVHTTLDEYGGRSALFPNVFGCMLMNRKLGGQMKMALSMKLV